MQFKAPPFLRCSLAFHGFTEADLREMEEIAISNGMFSMSMILRSMYELYCQRSISLFDEILWFTH